MARSTAQVFAGNTLVASRAARALKTVGHAGSAHAIVGVLTAGTGNLARCILEGFTGNTLGACCSAVASKTVGQAIRTRAIFKVKTVLITLGASCLACAFKTAAHAISANAVVVGVFTAGTGNFARSILEGFTGNTLGASCSACA